jgi:glutamate dehydrogenase (NAD(P)+)
LTRRYAAEIEIIIGPDKDVPAPDLGTDQQIMAWIMDTYSMQKGYAVPGVVTGKPVDIGGSRGRLEATGRGVQYIVEQACLDQAVALENATVAVQGFGNVGGVAARLLAREGARVVAISDSQGGIYRGSGLDIESLYAHRRAGGLIGAHPGHGVDHDDITNAELLALPVDILIPAALESQITEANASNVRAKMVVEAANGPVTAGGGAILDDRGIYVVPDILANAGGVVVSYFEWVQDLQKFFWEEAEVDQRLQKIMINAFREVSSVAEARGITLREAAYVVGVQRVVEAIKLRGIYP